MVRGKGETPLKNVRVDPELWAEAGDVIGDRARAGFMVGSLEQRVRWSKDPLLRNVYHLAEAENTTVEEVVETFLRDWARTAAKRKRDRDRKARMRVG